MKPLQLTDGAFFVSSSFLEGLETCTRKVEYSHLNKRIRVEDGNALFFGGVIHSAFNMHYRQQEFNTSKEEVLAKVVKIISAAFAERPESDDFRNLNWAVEVYRRFAEKFDFEQFQLLEYKEAIACPQCCSIIDQNHMGLGPFAGYDGKEYTQYKQKDCDWCNNTRKCKVMVEVPFVAKLFDYKRVDHEKDEVVTIPIYYRGFIDLPISINDRVYVLDFKTTSMLGESFWEDKKMSAQQKSYAWGLAKTTNLNVVGYAIRAIRVTQPPQWVTNGTANKKGEFKKIHEWWNESLVEQKFPFEPDSMIEWEQNAIGLVKEFFWHYQNQFFPKKTMWCVGKYGKCPYFDVCSTFPVEDRIKVLESGLYKDKEDVMVKI